LIQNLKRLFLIARAGVDASHPPRGKSVKVLPDHVF